MARKEAKISSKFWMEKQFVLDSKPSELALSRLKRPERGVEDRTGGLFNTLG